MDYKSEVERWLANKEVPLYLKQEIDKMNEEQKKDAFFKAMSFGTAGLRGLISPGSNSMNVITVKRASIGYGLALQKIFKEQSITVIIAHDNRNKSMEFARIAADTLSELGINVYLFDALRPTPLLSFSIQSLKAQGGIMITASHNPKEYNGFKVYDENGCQMSTDKSELVTEMIAKLPSLPPFNNLIATNPGFINVLDQKIDDEFIEACKSILINTDEGKRLKIVFTPQHGAAAVLGLRILTELGYDVFPVVEQMEPDPNFSNTITPNPEKPQAYVKAIELAKKVDADIILCTDPDADRVGFGYKSSSGDYILQTGNQTGAALIHYVLRSKKDIGTLPNKGGVIFQSVVTSTLGSRIAASFNVATETFLTGFKYIGDAIEKLKNTPEITYLFGYEESYGYLLADFCRDKDSIESLAIISEMANHYLIKGRRMDEVMDSIYNEYGYTINKNIEFNFKASSEGEAGKKLDLLRSSKLDHICGRKIIKIEDYLNQIVIECLDGNESVRFDRLPKENVLKYYLDDGCWFAIRPSGTEPKIKFYYECIGSTRNQADELPELFHEAISKLLG